MNREIKYKMLNFKKIAKSLRKTIAKETTESIDKWFNEYDKMQLQLKQLKKTIMTNYEKKVKELCDEIYAHKWDVPQIIIDFIQGEVEEMLRGEEPITSDAPGAAAYRAQNILEIIDPSREDAVDYLKRLIKALKDWMEDMRQVNSILGLPKTS